MCFSDDERRCRHNEKLQSSWSYPAVAETWMVQNVQTTSLPNVLRLCGGLAASPTRNQGDVLRAMARFTLVADGFDGILTGHQSIVR